MTEPGPHGRGEGAAAGQRIERRSGERIAVPYVCCWSPAPGAILNVSRTGVGIETFQSFARGDSIFLATRLEDGTQKLLGHVMWCRQIATAGGSGLPVYHVGIALETRLDEGWFATLVTSGRVPGARGAA